MKIKIICLFIKKIQWLDLYNKHLFDLIQLGILTEMHAYQPFMITNPVFIEY